jgi:hypothetical protein
MAVAQTSSTITARSGTTLGSGTATLYDCSGGTLTATSISATIYNLSTTSIATSTYVTIEREYITGLWLVVNPSTSFIENLRIDGSNLQYYKNGTWVTWHTGKTCE